MSEELGAEATPDNGAGKHRLALVLWNGDVGGAEVLNAKLGQQLRELGADVTMVFVGSPWPLAERLADTGLPYVSLGLGRGRGVLRHPRRYAAAVARAGADGALLLERGYMASALRAGGYRAPIVAVEHGSLLAERGSWGPRQLVRGVGRLTGALADDSEVAVSDFMLGRMRRRVHARSTRRIYNGIDPEHYRPAGGARPDGQAGRVVAGFAGRLVAGKGADQLIRAIAHARTRVEIELLIAGDGPERSALTALAGELGVASQVKLLGVVSDIPAFWQRCDIAAVPSDTWIESFSMVTLEAMSCGKALVATDAGAIPELVIDGATGTLVPPGDARALADALVAYARDPKRRERHGAAARSRAVERFHIRDCARAYLELFDELAGRRPRDVRQPQASPA